MRRLLFISNLFPDRAEPYRGLDNAVLLRYLRPHFEEIRALAIRPVLDPRRWGLDAGGRWTPRGDDAWLRPLYLGAPYVPKLGSHCNDHLLAASLKPALKALREQHGFACDVILCSWLFPDGAALSRVTDRPFALICQGSDAHQYLRIPARKSAILQGIARSGGVVTRSADLARLLKEAGAAPEKLHPIYNGADQTLFYPLEPAERQRRRAELGFGEPGAVVTLFVGNFLPVKNPRLLLEAFAKARNARPEAGARLCLIGGGPLEAQIREWISELGLDGVVQLAGRMDAAGVARYMQAADVLCMSSVNEGVPNVVLEAQATGVPVVSTDVGGIGEIIQTPEQGELTSPGEMQALAEALGRAWETCGDAERAAQRTKCICEIGNNYAWEKTAIRYAELLRQL